MRVNNKMIIQQMPWHANMTEMNHLGKALLIRPEKMESKFTQLFTAQQYSDNPLTAMLSGISEKTINTSEWEWDMKGATTRPLIIMRDLEPTNTQKGRFRQPFLMGLDEPWWKPGDIIHPGTSNKKYQVRIQEYRGMNGNAHEYLVQGNWDDPEMFIPNAFFQVNQPWAKLFSQYEEAAEQSGSTQYSLPIMLGSRLGRYRKMYEVTGDAAQEVLAVKIQGSDGKWYTSWIKYAEVEYWRQWYRELERGYWYSRSTTLVKGANGRPTRSGPGVQELLEDSHQHRYSHLTARLIEEFLMDIFYSRVKPGSQREIVAFTGEYGMINFHRAVNDELSRRGIMTIIDSNWKVQKTSSEYNGNALEYGYQFTKLRMANGAVMTLVHNPLYDDREINFEIDPVTGFPVESQRITFLDLSGGNGSGNIQLVHKANSFKHAYIAGLQTPYGPVNNGPAAHAGDYYEVHVQKQCGVQITDVSKCGELILSRN